MNRTVAAAVAAVFATLLCAVVFAGPAAAHAVLVGSTPSDGARLDRAPSEVSLTFDESVTLVEVATKVIVVDKVDTTVGGDRTDAVGVGSRVDAGRPSRSHDGTTIRIPLRPRLPIGSYAVTWRIVSADSHVVSGSIRFGIGVSAAADTHPSQANENRTLDIAASIARGVVYAGVILGLGVSIVSRYVWPWSLGRRRTRTLIRGGWGLCVIGTIGQLLLIGPQAAGSGEPGVLRFDEFGATAGSHIGVVLLTRLALLVVLILATAPALFDYRGTSRGRTAARGAGWLVSGGAMVVTVALVGHNAVGPAVWLSLGSDVAHLVAMSVWLGGLVTLGSVVLPRLRTARVRPSYLAPWSRTAFGCVGVLVLTGEYQALRQIQPLPSLWSTRYGAALLVKLAFVAAMLAAAWWTRRRLDDDRARGRGVAIEAALAIGVLAATTVLVSTAPARTVYGPAISASAPLGAGDVRVHVEPTRRGRQSIDLHIVSGAGAPVPAAAVTAVLSSEDAGIPALRLTVERDAADPSRWRSAGAVVPLPGIWTLTLTVTMAGNTAYVTSTSYPVW